MLRFGQVTEIDASKGLCRVNFEDDGIVSHWLPVIQLYTLANKASRVFDINEQVACLMDENLENGVVLGAIYDEGNQPDGATPDKLRVKFQDGASIEYDRGNGTLTVDGIKNLIIKAQTAVNVECNTATVKANASAEIETQIATVKAATSVTVDTPTATFTGLVIAAAIQTQPGAGGAGGLEITGDVTVSGSVQAQGEVTSGLIGLTSHKHGGVQPGGGTTGPATP